MEQGRGAPWNTGRNEPEGEGARKPRYINEPHLQNLGFVISNSKFRGAVHFGVVLGRLMSKDTRDPRDPEYPWQPAAPKMLQSSWGGESYLSRMLATFSYWNSELQEYRCPLVGIELDPFCAELLLHELPEQLTAAINGPLCYMSAGQICEYASLGLPEERMFRPNSPCARQCKGSCVRYRGASGIEFAKLGRAVFFQPQWQCVPRGVHGYRQLLSPLGEVRK